MPDVEVRVAGHGGRHDVDRAAPEPPAIVLEHDRGAALGRQVQLGQHQQRHLTGLAPAQQARIQRLVALGNRRDREPLLGDAPRTLAHAPALGAQDRADRLGQALHIVGRVQAAGLAFDDQLFAAAGIGGQAGHTGRHRLQHDVGQALLVGRQQQRVGALVIRGDIGVEVVQHEVPRVRLREREAACAASADLREGLAAFAAKREPQFNGR